MKRVIYSTKKVNHEKIFFWSTPVILLFILLTDIIASHLGADANWDLQNYHFYNGYLWMQNKLISDSLATVQSYLDPLLNSFYYILISTLTPLQVNLVIASLQSLSLTSVFFLSMIIFENNNFIKKLLISLAVSVSALFGPIFWSEIGGTMGDTLLASPVIIAIAFLAMATTPETSFNKRGYYVVIAGLLIGFVSGLKFTNMTYAVAMFFSMAAVLTIKKLRHKDTVLLLLAFSLAATISFLAIYWPVGSLLWNNFKNPIFPYFNDIFKSPYMAHYAIHDNRWFPTTLIRYVTLPFAFCVRHANANPQHMVGMEIPFKTYLFATIFILLPFYIVGQIKKIARKEYVSYNGMFVVIFSTISFIVWEVIFSYYRYLAVIEIIAPLTITIMLASFINNGFKNSVISVVLSFLVVVISAQSLPDSNWGREPFTSSYFGINKNSFINYKNSLIIVGHAPIGFVLPYFPSSDRIIGLPERIGGLTPAFQDVYLRKLRVFKGKMYYLSQYNKSLSVVKAHATQLKQIYNIKLKYSSCKEIKTNLYPLALCTATRN
jgi:hypothetical protein